MLDIFMSSHWYNVKGTTAILTQGHFIRIITKSRSSRREFKKRKVKDNLEYQDRINTKQHNSNLFYWFFDEYR